MRLPRRYLTKQIPPRNDERKCKKAAVPATAGRSRLLLKTKNNNTMRLEPLKQFICDGCGAVILQPQDAEILWSMEDSPEAYPYDHWYYNYKLVHKKHKSPIGITGCGLGDQLCNSDIEFFLECFLLQPQCKDIAEFQELMHRLTIPYYEEANLYKAEVLRNLDLFKLLSDGMTNAGFYRQIVEIYGE